MKRCQILRFNGGNSNLMKTRLLLVWLSSDVHAWEEGKRASIRIDREIFSNREYDERMAKEENETHV